ncbi:MAG: hypothetical protein M3Q31_08035 [Actinomycetota bacterium]|nr:hypothetical protein [Actinomycetota bacterium]
MPHAFHIEPQRMRKALRLVESGARGVAPLMTIAFPLERIGEAFETAVAKPDAFV